MIFQMIWCNLEASPRYCDYLCWRLWRLILHLTWFLIRTPIFRLEIYINTSKAAGDLAGARARRPPQRLCHLLSGVKIRWNWQGIE